jgi:hypothetical protein
MKLSWKDYAIIFGLLIVAAVAVAFLFPKTVETDEATGKQKIKTNFLKIGNKD